MKSPISIQHKLPTHAPLPPAQEIWIRAWCAVASANDCKEMTTASNWANDALKQFRKVFPNA